VAFETEVTSYPGLSPDGTFRNVVLDMIPSSTGKLLGNNWQEGTNVEIDFTWDYVSFIEDLEDLCLVAFVQDRDHGWVLQADAVYYSPLVGMPAYEKDNHPMVLYPNPARDQLTIFFGNRTEMPGQIEVVDISGREVMVMEVQRDITTQQMDISHLPEGLFMIFWKESGLVRGHARFIRNR
jgi:hypothetical protein